MHFKYKFYVSIFRAIYPNNPLVRNGQNKMNILHYYIEDESLSLPSTMAGRIIMAQ